MQTAVSLSDSPLLGSVRRPVERVSGAAVSLRADALAVEEPLEIRLGFVAEGRRAARSLSVTMRTPGHDRELAAGFLLTEGVVADAADIDDVDHDTPNVVRVDLRPQVRVDMNRLERHFYTASSCGVCGKTSIAAVQVCQRQRLDPDRPRLGRDVVCSLPEKLRAAQEVFDRTGGLHAAALFDAAGRLLTLREDVGRHNAVDKVIGAELLAGRLPLAERVLLVSGRASFELVQKALLAGVPVLAAVGAPSSLAVDLARDRGMTLLGFVRDGRFNIYSGAGRVLGCPEVRPCDETGHVQPAPLPQA